MAVVPRSSAGAQPPRHGATPAARARLYGISRDAADIRGGALSKTSGRGVENVHRTTSVVYQGDADDGGGGGGLGSCWCACLSGGSAVASPPAATVAKRGGRGSAGHGGDVVKSLSGSFEARRRSSASPGKVSPLVEAVPPLDSVQELAKEFAPGVFSMSNLSASAGRSATHAVDSGVLSSSVPIDPGESKNKATPTTFGVMSHEPALLQGAKPGRPMSLSQQLTFQEKMKSFLSGTLVWRKFQMLSLLFVELGTG